MEEQRYWEQELTQINIEHLLKWIIDRQLVAVVDDDYGGIIGYVSRDYSEEILKQLNNSK